MLALRLQRTGRKGYALYRLVAQDAHRSPMSGKVAAYLGSYDPHAKTFTVDRTKVEYYLEHGAQPSPRVIVLLEKEGLKLPDWVRRAPTKQHTIKKPEKLRKNRPPEAATPAEKPTEETQAEQPADEKASEAPAEADSDKAETPAAKPTETPAEAEPKPGPEAAPEETPVDPPTEPAKA